MEVHFDASRSISPGPVPRDFAAAPCKISLASAEKNEFAQELILRGLIDPESLRITEKMRALPLPEITDDVKRTLEQSLKERSSFELPNRAKIEYSASDFLDYLRKCAPEIEHFLVGSYLVDLLLTSVYYRALLKEAWGVSWLPYSIGARDGDVRLLLPREWPEGSSQQGIFHFLEYLFETNKLFLIHHKDHVAYAKELIKSTGSREVVQEVKQYVKEEIGRSAFLNKKFLYEPLDSFSLFSPKGGFFEYIFVERLRRPYLFSKNGIFLSLNNLQIYSHEEESGSAHQALVDYLLGVVYYPDVEQVNYGGWFRALREVSVKEGTFLVPEQFLKLLEQSLAYFRTYKNFLGFCMLLSQYVGREGLPYLLHATLFFAEHGSLLSSEERIEIGRILFCCWRAQEGDALVSPEVRPGPGMEQSISSLLRSDSLAENCAGLFLLDKVGSRLGEHVNPGATFLKLLAAFHARKYSSDAWLRFGLKLDLQCRQPCTEEEQEALDWLLETYLDKPEIGAPLLRWIQTKGALAGLPLERKAMFFPLGSCSPLEILEKLRASPLFDQEECFIAFLSRFQEGDSNQQSMWDLECHSYFTNHPEEMLLSRLIAAQRKRGEETLSPVFPLMLPGAIDCALKENIIELFPTFVSIQLESYEHTRGESPLFPLITSCGSDESFMTFATQLFQTLAQDASKNGEAFYQMVRHLNSMQRSDLLQKIAHDEALLASILDPHFGAVPVESAHLFDGWIRLSQALLESAPPYATVARLVVLGRKLLPLSVQIPQGRSEVYHDFVHCALKLMCYLLGTQNFNSKQDADELLTAVSEIVLPALEKERVPKALVQATVDLCFALGQNALWFSAVPSLTFKAVQERWLSSGEQALEMTARIASALVVVYFNDLKSVSSTLKHPVRDVFDFLKRVFEFNEIKENCVCFNSFSCIYEFYFSFLHICLDKREQGPFFLSAMETLKERFPLHHAYVTFCLLPKYLLEADSDIGKLVLNYLNNCVKIDELPLPDLANFPYTYSRVLYSLFEQHRMYLKCIPRDRYIPFVKRLFASAQREMLGSMTTTWNERSDILSKCEWSTSKELRWALCYHHAESLRGQEKPAHIMHQWQTILCQDFPIGDPDHMSFLIECFLCLFNSYYLIEKGKVQVVFLPSRDQFPIWEKSLVQWVLHFKKGESLIPPDRTDVRESLRTTLNKVLLVALTFVLELRTLKKEVQGVLDQMQERQQLDKATSVSDTMWKGIFSKKEAKRPLS